MIQASIGPDHWQHQLAHLGQHRRIRPRRVADKVKQRLVLGRDLPRRRYRRHRLHALARDRQQEAQAVVVQRFLAIGMAQGRAQLLDIGRKSRFTSPTNRIAHSGPHPEKQTANLRHIESTIYL
jgi:hypothetical protein